MNATNIEWATHTIAAPVKGCEKVSAGCKKCYALRDSWRLANNHELPKRTRNLYKKVVTKKDGRPAWSGEVVWDDQVLPRAIRELSRARKPRRVFVESMGDLFHEAIGDDRIDEALALAALFPDHTFLYLTKRAERLPDYFNFEYRRERVYVAAGEPDRFPLEWPLPNAWIGVTVENQAMADARIPFLLESLVAVRFVSMEPLLGMVNLAHVGSTTRHLNGAVSTTWFNALTGMWPDCEVGGEFYGGSKLDGVILGGESGPGARPMHPDWARANRDRCVAAGVPFFFKQWGEWGHGSDSKAKTVCVYRDGRFVDFNREAMLQEERKSGIPHQGSDGTLMARVGKKRAGRLLDGRTWDQMPGRLV